MRRTWLVMMSLVIVGGWVSVNATADPKDPRDSDKPFGVLDFLPWNDDWNRFHYPPEKVNEAAQLMSEAGVNMLRMDFLWKDIEPEKGRFDFSKYDKIMAVLDEKDIKVLAILEYNPLWRQAEWNAAPITADYVAFAQATVRHFKDRVKYWEIWNEPDSKTYWIPQDDLTAYSALLKAVYPAIKAEDPTAKVVLGGLTENGAFGVRSIYRKVGKQYFDVMNMHPFVDPMRPNPVQKLKGIYISLSRSMKEFGDADKPIWFTEIGCPGVRPGTPLSAWWQGHSPTEAQQAKWVRELYTNAPQWAGVQRVFWAFFRDTNDFFHSGVDSFGLVRTDFSKKPAYEVYKQLAHTTAVTSRIREDKLDNPTQ